MIYQVVIVEDEIHQQRRLKELIQQVESFYVAGIASSVDEAQTLIFQIKPHLVFLDVELPPHTSFDLLNKMGRVDFKIVFTTAFDEYAVRAFKFSALDYLLKPIAEEELHNALGKFKKEMNTEQQAAKIENLLANLSLAVANPDQKIALPTLNGFLLVAVKEIVRCESDNTYTTFYTTDKRKIVVSKTLKEVEHMLDGFSFFRVHNSHLINLKYIAEYVRGEGGVVRMIDGSHVDVSRRRKDEFLLKLRKS